MTERELTGCIQDDQVEEVGEASLCQHGDPQAHTRPRSQGHLVEVPAPQVTTQPSGQKHAVRGAAAANKVGVCDS